jgi:pyrroline-5-carboxylate reductase
VSLISRLAFVGGGVMGEAMIRGALNANLLRPDQVRVADAAQERRDLLQNRYQVRVSGSNRNVLAGAEVVVLAVKPEQAGSVLGELRGVLRPGQLFLSVVAGVPLAALAAGLDHSAVVRVIPNTPAQVGAGVSAWMASAEVDAVGRSRAAALLGALGRAVEVEDEDYLDMATALSGSGPAYAFLFLEALIDAGVHVGLPRATARLLAAETLLGAALMARDGDIHPAQLRNMVTSPGGTTAAGLAELEAGGLRAAVDQAVVAAYNRSVELGRGRPPPEEERR